VVERNTDRRRLRWTKKGLLQHPFNHVLTPLFGMKKVLQAGFKVYLLDA
jgi:hypothetical protein